ncbi:MAG: chorismate mutase [Novosphingobium sp.]|nr:chorismate mutase [Novosphingobium sp.]
MAEDAPAADPVLAAYRRSIDNYDAALVHILAERFRTTQAVGRHKAEKALPAADPGREERQIARLRKLALEADLDPEFTEKFLRFIIDEVIRHHQRTKAST